MFLVWLAVLLVVGGAITLAVRRWRSLPGHDDGRTAADRMEALALRRPVVVADRNLAMVALGTARRSGEVRVTGLAAEMTYYALISLVPLASAFGAALGFMELVVGRRQADRLEVALVDSVASVFDEDVADSIVVPVVQGMLQEQRAGLAVGGIVIALWLAGRMFRAAIRALDDAYQVQERRTFLQQVGLGAGLSVGAIAAVLTLLTLIVVGPLFGGGQALAERLQLGGAAHLLWDLARWPTALVVVVLSLLALYRFGPNVSHTWRQCWPGAAIGTLALIVVAQGLQTYFSIAGPRTPQLDEATRAAETATQVLGSVLAVVLWVWLSSIVVLTCGVLNAELERERTRPVDHVEDAA